MNEVNAESHLKSHLKKRKDRRRGRLAKDGFTLLRRRGSQYWAFYCMENGKRISHSTGKTDKAEAEAIAREYLKPKASQENVTFGEFAKDFFVWDQCAWIRAQHAAGRTFSKGAAIGRRVHLTKWIPPKYGARPLSSITPKELRDWIISLPLSGQTKNHLKYTLKTVFGEAVFAGLITSNPVADIRNVALNRKERDAFTLEDLGKLFPTDNRQLFRLWGDARMAMLALTLAATGIRSGEARALHWRHVRREKVHLPDGAEAEVYYLLIEQGVKFFSDEIGSTKSGKPRPVFLPERARCALEWWKKNTFGGKGARDLVFPGNEDGRLIRETLLRARFKKALELSGVDVNGRNLVPHSFRHAYVTRSKRALPAGLLLLMAGHADEKVQAGYFHPQLHEHLLEMAASRSLIESTGKW
jgi:integrase